MSTKSSQKPCPFQMPETELTSQGFARFCHSSMGVSPQRVVADINSWLDEDHGSGDVTLLSLGKSAERQTRMFIVAKEEFVLSGLDLMAQIMRIASGEACFLYSNHRDGAIVRKGDVVLGGLGSSTGFLLGERVALNTGSRLSGITTKTAAILRGLNAEASGKCPVLLETRKTTPGLRRYEKYATRCGGATNHRHGLDSGAMLKENHLRMSGGVSAATGLLKSKVPVLTKIEVEVADLTEFREAALAGADVIMLDNFVQTDVAIAVAQRNTEFPAIRLELSGNLDRQSPSNVARSGVDFVSMGALIHQAVWVDMSLQLYV